MGQINLTIQQGQQFKTYMLSYSANLERASLTEIHNGAIIPIKEFNCKRFQDCFCKLKRSLTPLGEVTQLSATGVTAHNVVLLNDMLIEKSDGILPINSPENIIEGPFWNWLQHDRYMGL